MELRPLAGGHLSTHFLKLGDQSVERRQHVSQVLAENLSPQFRITGGHAVTELPSDKINIEWVLGNKLLLGSVNANREHFEAGIKDLALGEVMYPNVLQRILTSPVEGLDNYADMMRLLMQERPPLKVYVNVADE